MQLKRNRAASGNAILFQYHGSSPLAEWTVVSGYGIRDLNHDGIGDPGNHGGYRFHDGFDLRAPVGTPVYAAFSGTVVVAGHVIGYGTTIYINSGP